MNNNHTPGPWWFDDDGLIAGGHSDSYVTVAEVFEKADAPLIAAAPELLAALACCVGLISGEHSDTDADKQEVLEIARDAIAKATSEAL